MILKPTTLVLGAGASMPYGMPSGAELRSLICDTEFMLKKMLQLNFSINKSEIVDFITYFSLSNIGSIDAFLSKNERFTKIGKLCIAAILCSKEDPKVVENPLLVGPDNNEDHWYFHLWQDLISDVSSANDLLRNNIRFVTFNYDRSLEYFLHQSMQHAFSINSEQAFLILRQIKICHVYGSLGNFHYNPNDGERAYSLNNNAKEIEVAANGIKVIPEARDNMNDTFYKARDWLYESANIGFLGFGFDRLNVERLGLSEVIKLRLDNKMLAPYVIASTFSKTAKEIEKIQVSLMPHSPSSIQAIIAKNTMTLRNSHLLG